jgi:hypothetical protein
MTIGASGGAYARIEYQEKDYAVLVEGSVDAAYKRIGNVIYVSAKGEGHLAVYAGKKLYLDKRVAGADGWQIVISSSGVTALPIGYAAASGITGHPGSPDWMERDH